MKKKTINLLCLFLIMGVFLIFASSCKKDNDNKGNDNNTSIPVLTTTVISDITQTTAKGGGNITSDGGATITARGVCWSTEQTPTILDNKTTEGTGTGSFASSISDLTTNTDYFVRAYASNSNGTAYGDEMSFTTQVSSGNTFTDPRDGNVYHTVTIGTQVWMVENLRYLPGVVGPGTTSQTMPYYYVYGYNGTSVTEATATANFTTYGVLYNWPAAVNACPTGWHLPSDAEWTELTDSLGGPDIACGKLKETGTTHWSSPNTGATNETGFTALPGGEHNNLGEFFGVGEYGFWWSATEDEYYNAWGRYMQHYFNNVIRYTYGKDRGFSVRCIRD